MDAAHLDPILSMGILVCAVMAVINLLRFKSRGPAAFALAAAFVSLGFTAWLLKVNATQPVIIGGILLTVLLLGADFGLRSRRSANGGRKK